MPESHCQQKLTKAAESALRAGNFPSVYDDCANGVHASYIYPPGRGSNGTLTGRTFMEITQTRYALHADQYNRIAGRQNWNDYAQGRGSLAMGRGANEAFAPPDSFAKLGHCLVTVTFYASAAMIVLRRVHHALSSRTGVAFPTRCACGGIMFSRGAQR
jgi:hypothetical protein